jgi:transcriptional regulator with XRE-family HTH domain
MELAHKVGMSASQICLWERGYVELPAADVERIAHVLETELSKQPKLSSASQIAGMLVGANV